MNPRRNIGHRPFTGSPLRQQVADEVRFHIEGRVEELIEQGWSAPDARAEALRRFGDRELFERECLELDRQRRRKGNSKMLLDSARTDLKLAARTVLNQPVFSLVVVVTLALGIGATTAIFSVLEAHLLSRNYETLMQGARVRGRRG